MSFYFSELRQQKHNSASFSLSRSGKLIYCGLCKGMALRFQFDETKAVEALAYIATRWPRVTAFSASKILFFAEKLHLNRYGRPIVADTFIAMPNGPVPSTIYDFIKGNLDQAGDPEAITKAIEIERSQYAHIKALRPADRDALSPSDIECLDEAIALSHDIALRRFPTGRTKSAPTWRPRATGRWITRLSSMRTILIATNC